MLVYLYLAALIFGGVLLGSSVLLGGHDDADFDADTDFDSEAEVAHEHGVGGDFLLWPLRSLRFWTFFLASFGLTGILLHGFGIAGTIGAIGALIASLAVGSVSGLAAATIIRRLIHDESGRAASSQDYIGKSAKVLVPVRAQSVGKIRVRVKGQQVDLLAVTDEDDLTSDDEVIVIEMEGTRARIARLDRN